MKKTSAVIAILGAALAFPAAAQMRAPAMSSAYVGANLGQSKFKIECGAGESCDDKDTAFKLFAGLLEMSVVRFQGTAHGRLRMA